MLAATNAQSGIDESIAYVFSANPELAMRIESIYEVFGKLISEVEEYELSSAGFGREHPFRPLISRDIVRIMDNAEPEMDSKIAAESIIDDGSNIKSSRLTSVFIVNNAPEKSTAIIEENGVSRSISIGDTVSGMEVLEIHRGEIILYGKGEKYAMNLNSASEILE
jgi:hypothetical protein